MNVETISGTKTVMYKYSPEGLLNLTLNEVNTIVENQWYFMKKNK